MQITTNDLLAIVHFLKSGKWSMGAEESIALVDTIVRIESMLKTIADKEKELAEKKNEEAKPKAPEKKVEPKTK